MLILLTPEGGVVSPLKLRQAPPPLLAHQRRVNAGAETTPTTGTPSSNSAMSDAHTGTPRT